MSIYRQSNCKSLEASFRYFVINIINPWRACQGYLKGINSSTLCLDSALQCLSLNAIFTAKLGVVNICMLTSVTDPYLSPSLFVIVDPSLGVTVTSSQGKVLGKVAKGKARAIIKAGGAT